jgi:hypothetical protein
MVLPRKATSRRPSRDTSPRWDEKFPTTAWTSMPYEAATSAAASRSTSSLTSRGTNRRSVPAAAMASRSSRVFSDVPEPSSTSVPAPARAAISPAEATRIERSARVR